MLKAGLSRHPADSVYVPEVSFRESDKRFQSILTVHASMHVCLESPLHILVPMCVQVPCTAL